MPFNLETLRQQMGSTIVLSDIPSITAYSIDAGIYKINPRGIVLIESGRDLEAVLKYARDHQVPLTARSGGTNLTGNAIGEGLILEFSRLNQLLEINSSEQWARVQPGMTYAELNCRLAREGWMFGPDPSSGEMCKVGGMLGNNSAGPHTLKYGATKDNVLEMDVLLANGNWIVARDYQINSPQFQNLILENPFLGSVVQLIQEHLPLILVK
ncbi:MAG: FAD-binding oxidoreductase, partial [Chitinophagales bacterium]